MGFQGNKIDLISGSSIVEDTPGFIDLTHGQVTNIGTFEQDPLDPFSVQMSGSSPSASFYMSSSGKTGIGTTDPLTDVDVRADNFQIQKQGKRQGILVNEEGNLESFNSETDSAATGSEFILKYSRGGSGAITKEFLEAVGVMSAAEVDGEYGGNALTAFNTFDPKTRDKLLFELESPAFAKLSESSVGDVLGSIRWVATSGSSTGLNSRTAGEAATIQAVVNLANQFGTSADLLFKVAGKAALEGASSDLGAAAATQTALRLDGSFAHELTGSLAITNTLSIPSTITHLGDPDTNIGFTTNNFYVKAGNEINLNVGQSQVTIGDGGNVDLQVKALGDQYNLFSDGGNARVGIGTNSPSHKLDVHGNARITGSLTVNGSLTATQITSSIVSSSVIYSSGSNIFGDATADTHTFNGHITASGNISSSGTITAAAAVLTTADINGGTIDGATIATSNITVGADKTLEVRNGTLNTSAAQNLTIIQSAASNIDIGAYELRAQTLESDVATGTAPLTIASTTEVANLHSQTATTASFTTNFTASGDISSSGIITGQSASFAKVEITDPNIIGQRHLLFNSGIYINDNPLLVDNGYFGSSLANTPSNWNDPTPAAFDSSAGTFEQQVDITEDEHGSKIFHAPFAISRIEVLSSWRTAGTGDNEAFWCGIWTGSAGIRLGASSGAHNTIKNIGFVTGSKHTFDNGGDWEGHNNDLDFTFSTPLPAFTQIYYGMGTGETSSVGTKNIRGYITMMVYEA